MSYPNHLSSRCPVGGDHGNPLPPFHASKEFAKFGQRALIAAAKARPNTVYRPVKRGIIDRRDKQVFLGFLAWVNARMRQDLRVNF